MMFVDPVPEGVTSTCDENERAFRQVVVPLAGVLLLALAVASVFQLAGGRSSTAPQREPARELVPVVSWRRRGWYGGLRRGVSRLSRRCRWHGLEGDGLVDDRLGL